MTELGLALAAALGAPARYVVDVMLIRRYGAHRPLGTLSVNLCGSFLLGLLTGLGLHHGLSPSARAVWGTGFCGALTTYSAFSYEAVRLMEQHRRAECAWYVGISLVGGLGAAALGLGLALL